LQYISLYLPIIALHHLSLTISPAGAYLADGSEYRGNYAIDRDVLTRFHRQRALVLAGCPGADLLVFETIPELREALVIVGLMGAELAAVPYCITFQCRNSAALASGDDVATTARRVLQAAGYGPAGESPLPLGAAAALAGSPRPRSLLVGIGVNCVAPQHACDLVRTMRKVVADFAPGAGGAVEVICRPNRYAITAMSPPQTPL